MYDTTMGAMVFEKKQKNGTCKVYEDTKGNQRIITTADIAPGIRANRQIRDMTYRSKQTQLFSSKHNQGDRIIARVPTDVFVNQPELMQDDKAFEHWLDHDDIGKLCKAMPAHFSRTTPGKGLVHGFTGKTE
jgi:hypothetical protein